MSASAASARACERASERSADDWPFLEEVPPGREQLQRALVDHDPFFRLLGVRLAALERDRATLAFEYRSELSQPTGILHGGLHAVVIDSAVAQALLTTLRPEFTVVTMHLDTKYFAPVRGGEVSVCASVVRKGKRVAHGEASVFDERGAMVARGWGVFAVTRM